MRRHDDLVKERREMDTIEGREEMGADMTFASEIKAIRRTSHNVDIRERFAS